MTGGRVGRFFESKLLAEALLSRVRARAFGAFAFGRQSAGGRLDLAGIQLVQLLYVGNDVRNLRREGATFFGRDVQMREQRDFLDVCLVDRHNLVIGNQ
ncbi:MAG TPA: hypothetical protein VEQ40_04635 [Pyrinomonadaceae bacterium]|nr:hypothetical protein [Pyrinomonadaceae bacterium]